MDRENPYEALTSDVVTRAAPASDPRPLQTRWSGVFLANLPLAGFFGVLMTFPLGTIGLMIAVGVLYTLGRRACTHAQPLARALIIGGIVVATAQVMVLPHLWVGGFSVGLTGMLLDVDVLFRGDHLGSNLLGGFLATLFTGGILMGIALALGVPLGWCFPAWYALDAAGSKSAYPRSKALDVDL